MAKKIKALSVFFPAYNEEVNIEKTVRQAKGILLQVVNKWEILVINDGSTDKTGQVVAKLRREDKRIDAINHPTNQGYGAALKSGFSNARYPWVAFTDSDGQFNFSEIKKFLPLMENSDLILGYRLNRADSFLRKIYTFAWGKIPVVLWGLRVKDYSCGFKLIKKKVFSAVQPLVGEEKVTQIEMLVKAKRKGFKFAEIGVRHYPRKHGAQTGANIKVVVKSVTDLFKLWKKLR